MYRSRTGPVLVPYFSCTKLIWLFRESAALRQRAENSHLAFGTIDSFLVWWLTGGKTSNALEDSAFVAGATVQ